MKRNTILACSFWTALVLASFVWNFLQARENQRVLAFQTAKAFFNQVLLTRSWNAGHGGVYVLVNGQTRPNPYLIDPLRDIEVRPGLKLTKVNPAFMTREIAEIAARCGQIQFHITSLKPLRPENRPTPREEKALIHFENGLPETGEMVAGEPGQAYFYMASLKTERPCLGCHAKQGYKEGDIRGGISVTLPFVSDIPLLTLGLGHLALALAGILGIILSGFKLERAYESLRHQAVIDSLTGIPNRRSFSERILIEYGRSRREKTPLSLILADIDHFKLFNDTYGHKQGDECLRRVASEIQRGLKRPGDFCARYGGEEFILILPNTEASGAQEVAEAIRKGIQRLKIPHKQALPVPMVTLSLGVATLDLRSPFYYEDLINAADQALYRAKERGRNRVEGWEGQTN